MNFQALLLGLRRRLNERSTWMLIGSGIAGASVLASPWSYVSAIVGIIAALVPDGTVVVDGSGQKPSD